MSREPGATADAPPGKRTRDFVVGVDGGGTSTRVVIADLDGRELARRTGTSGLIDPRDPAATISTLVVQIRQTAAEAGADLPARALCAGLAGAGAAALREQARDALAAAGLAERVAVVQDGEIALEGALAGQPGVLLVAGTGSVAYGRAEDGRVARCGGWGRFVGDEGSGYAIASAALRSALQCVDGRGEETRLVPELLSALDLAEPLDIPPWAARAEKADVAALGPVVMRLAEEGDAVASRIVAAAADELALHVHTLLARLAPWSAPVPVAFHGGALREEGLARGVEDRLRTAPFDLVRQPPVADAASGAVRRALSL